MKTISGKAAFDKAVKKRGIVVIDFKGKWCPPCKKLGALLVKMERALGSIVTFYTIDVDVKKNKELVKKEKVEGIPHLCFYKNGKKVQCLVGLYPSKYYNDLFSELI